jgi:hypothetical protein
VVAELVFSLEHHDPQRLPGRAGRLRVLDQPAIQLGDLRGEGQAGDAPTDDRHICSVDLSIIAEKARPQGG